MLGITYEYDDFQCERQIDDFHIRLPKKPKKSHVVNYDIPKHRQRFRPPKLPEGINGRYLRGSLTEADIAFIDQEYYRRKYGYWFYNNGNLEYVTGLHYFYLSYWKITLQGRGFGLPNFKDSDRDYFYIWDHCANDPDCYGLLHVTNRRDGKTHRGNVTGYEAISRSKRAIMGIQSKTYDDASQVFDKIVAGWRKLPEFFKPTDTGDSNPKKALRFDDPAKRTSKTQIKKYSEVLESEISYMNAKDEAYDGGGLRFKFDDEVGKTNSAEGDIYNRWEINKYCLVDGNIITGKALQTTTVEELDGKSFSRFKKLWEESDIKKKNLGRTKSGLYRYFKPASYGLEGVHPETKQPFVDEYGYSNIELAEDYIIKSRKEVLGEGLASLMRKYPLTIGEAFMISNDSPVFNLDKIAEQQQHNLTIPKNWVVRGNFYWKGGHTDLEVAWSPDSNGKFQVIWMPPVEERNKSEIKYMRRTPSNQVLGSIGVDPYDHKYTTASKHSKAAAHVFRKFHPMDPYDSNNFVCQYYARPEDPRIFYEDILMMSVFYGYQVLAENNKPGLVNHFRERGYLNYLMDRPRDTHTTYSRSRQEEKGIPMTGVEARGALIEVLKHYITNNIGRLDPEKFGDSKTAEVYSRCYFAELLDDWGRFTGENWTPHDLTVSSGLALLGAMQDTRKIEEPTKVNVQQLFKVYNNRGRISKRVRV